MKEGEQPAQQQRPPTSLRLNDVTTLILNQPDPPFNGCKPLRTITECPCPPPTTTKLPPISNLFQVAGAAHNMGSPDAAIAFEEELQHSSMWLSNDPAIPLPSPQPLLALTAMNAFPDLRSNRTIPLPPVSPPPFAHGFNQPFPHDLLALHESLFSPAPDRSSVPYNIIRNALIQGGSNWGPQSLAMNTELATLTTDQEPSFPLPPFQPSSSTLHNALGLTFGQTAHRPPSPLDNTNVKKKFKEDKSKPLTQCRLCPKSFTTTGMSRHIAWHRRRGDTKRSSQTLANASSTITYGTKDSLVASASLPDLSEPSSGTESPQTTWNASPTLIHVPKPIPPPIRPQWAQHFSISLSASPSLTETHSVDSPQGSIDLYHRSEMLAPEASGFDPDPSMNLFAGTPLTSADELELDNIINFPS